ARTFMLRSVAKSFIMALNHRDAYRIIHKMGTQDLLTDMKNRNSYEQAVKSYKNHEKIPLGCIYIDANGLHELNNEQGHEAGDMMLRCIADEMKVLFGADKCYRVGGDEFIILTDLDTPELIEKKLEVLEQHLFKHGYYISYGYSWTPSLTDYTKLVRDAEQRMYECKRVFYSGPPNGRRIEDKILPETENG
ncbi:MAG: GGDEF domain-containing protein, partial [bacterium]|nr:GGDEF domain-containing protein [bacterium]